MQDNIMAWHDVLCPSQLIDNTDALLNQKLKQYYNHLDLL